MLCNKASPNSTTTTVLLLMRLYVHWTVCPWPRALDWGLVVQDVLSHMEARWLWWSVGAEGQQDDGGDWAMQFPSSTASPGQFSSCFQERREEHKPFSAEVHNWHTSISLSQSQARQIQRVWKWIPPLTRRSCQVA